jgi:hypothetical protein
MKEQDRYSTFECALEAREARNDERVRSLNEELEHAMTQGLAGFAAGVPSYRSFYDPGFAEAAKVETTQTAGDGVLEALQSLEPMHALMMCLKDSACPLVAKLRAEVVKQYVADNAEGIDAARGYK